MPKDEENEATIYILINLFKALKIANLGVGRITKLITSKYDSFDKIVKISFVDLKAIVDKQMP